MKKSFFIDFKITMPLLIILFVFLTPIFTYAQTEPETNQKIETTEQEKNVETQPETTAEATTETYFNCIDKYGKQIMTNLPVEGYECSPVGTYDRVTEAQKAQYRKEKEEKRIAEEKARIEYEREAEERAKEQRLIDLENEAQQAKKEAAEAKAAAARAWDHANGPFWINGRVCQRYDNTIRCR